MRVTTGISGTSFPPINHATLEPVGLTALFSHLIFDVVAQTQEGGAAEIERYRRRLLAL